MTRLPLSKFRWRIKGIRIDYLGELVAATIMKDDELKHALEDRKRPLLMVNFMLGCIMTW